MNGFKRLNQRLGVSNCDYIRTTDPYHEATSQRLWKICSDAGDIYLDRYEGWYDERAENFVSETEAKETDFKDPSTGIPFKKVTEESYFFRLSAYTAKLIAYIEENPLFIQPESFKNNILQRLHAEGLKDLSLSRTSFTWGIKMPDGFDDKHVMYVWFDALTNYLSGVHALDGDHPLSRYWPANRHIIGKDIIWFHCVIWPCMLMSASIPLPENVFAHGFVCASDGKRMGKSLGNAVDPHDVLDKFPVDSVRYYCCASTTYGSDVNFSESSLVSMHNSELADVLGNLVNRALVLCHKYCDGFIPDSEHDSAFLPPFSLETMIADISADMKSSAIHLSIFRAMEAARITNRFLTEAEPWKMVGANESRRPAIVRTTLELIYAFSLFLAPVMPFATESIFSKLNTKPVPVNRLDLQFYNLKPGTKVDIGEILFRKIDVSDVSQASSMGAAEANISGKVKGKEKLAIAPKVELDSSQNDFTKIELRVGKIIKIKEHETAERLFCEDIDIGEKILQVASGLRQHYTLDEMLERKVVVVCNMKESKMQGFMSYGMVLAAKCSTGKVELVEPPVESLVGERVLIEGLSGNPWPAADVKKKKVWETVAPGLRTTANCTVSWNGLELITSGGRCTVPSIASSPVS